MRAARSAVSRRLLSSVTATTLRSAEVAASWNGLVPRVPRAIITASASSTVKFRGANVCVGSRQ
jgi:hypothetical protein